MMERSVSFDSDGHQLEGVLRFPDQRSNRFSGVINSKDQLPGILLVHGSLEQDRDGNLLATRDNRKVFPKNFFLRLSRRLCSAGFTTFSWDRRGFGRSQGTPGDYFTQADDASSALELLCSLDNIVDPNRISVFGQSAGVYVSCLMAARMNHSIPKAFVFSGGLCSDYREMMMYNYHRVRNYAMENLENLHWIENNDLWGLALGLNLGRMFRAIDEHENEIRIEYKDHAWTLALDSRLYSQTFSPRILLKHITCPTLIIHGESDLNVPVGDALKMEQELRKYGNNHVELVIIPGADHSFQQAAVDRRTALRERMSLESFRRPYVEDYFLAIISFLKRRFYRETHAK